MKIHVFTLTLTYESIFMNKITIIYSKFKNTKNLNLIYGKQNVFRIAEFFQYKQINIYQLNHMLCVYLSLVS